MTQRDRATQKLERLMEPFGQFAEHLADTRSIVSIAHWGALFLTQEEKLMDSTGGFNPLKGERIPDEETAKIRNRAKVSMQEREQDFPLLHSHALMGAWGVFEAFIEDVCIKYMQEYPEKTEGPAFSKVAIPYAEIKKLEEVEMLRYILNEAQRIQRSNLRQGITSFEGTLSCVGLDGEVHPSVRQAIYQAQQMRNVIAHRAGVADRRLCENCPDLHLTPGQKIKISTDQLDYILDALRLYCLTIMNRILVAWGANPILDATGVTKQFEQALNVQYRGPTETNSR